MLFTIFLRAVLMMIFYARNTHSNIEIKENKTLNNIFLGFFMWSNI